MYMDSKSKKSINTIGRIGKVISTIMLVLTILGAAAVLACTVCAAVLPKETIDITFDGDIELSSAGTLFEKLDKLFDIKQDGDGAKVSLAGTGAVTVDIAGDDDILKDSELIRTDRGYKIDIDKRTVSLNTGRVVYCLAVSLLSLICTAVVLIMIRSLMKSLEACDTPFCDEIIKKMKRFGWSLVPFVFLRGLEKTAWNSIASNASNFGISIDFTFIVGILVVFMLAIIFSYGARLQKESDETV